jgi:hypothetical protein
MEKYYHIPFRFGEITTKGKELKEVSLLESIANNCTLIIGSRFRSHRFDTQFGCALWDRDFDISEDLKWEEDLQKSVTNSVQKYERRLEQIRIDLKFGENIIRNKNNAFLRKSIKVSIQAKIKTTGESFFFEKILYISPVEL